MLEGCKSHSYRMRTNSHKTLNVSACVSTTIIVVANKYIWYIVFHIAMIRSFYYCITYTIDTVSAGYQQQGKEDYNVKEQSTDTELIAQKLVLSLHDKQGTIIDSWNKHGFIIKYFCDV